MKRKRTKSGKSDSGAAESHLSLKQENYLETIHALCSRHRHAHIKDIASALGVKMPSATEAVKNLAAAGLINYRQRHDITLTLRGEELAQELSHRQEVLADFFSEIMGFSAERAEELACRIEHSIDRDFTARLAEFAKFIRMELTAGGENPVLDFARKYRAEEKI